MHGKISFARPDGSFCEGYLAQAGSGRPSVVVIQEWWGLNDQICGVVDRFARAGFNALAPDLFKGRVTQDPDEASHLMTGLDFDAAARQDIFGAVQHLAAHGGKVGVMGYCMGGALAIAAGVHVPGLSAAVSFYGIPPKAFADPAQLRVPLQGHFGSRDSYFSSSMVEDLAQAARAAGQDGGFFTYDADHAFCNERRGSVYQADHAQTAWERMIDFLNTRLA